MAADSTITATTSSGLSVSTDNIISVRRGNRDCREILENLAYTQESGSYTSIYLGSALFPIFYVRSGVVYIKPDPSTGSIGKVSVFLVGS